MYCVLWEYEVRPECLAEFEALYGSGGAWSRLFRGSGHYLGTELYRDLGRQAHYLTVDRWTSREDYEAFLETVPEAYRRLDADAEGLTLRETRLGAFTG